MKDLEPKIIGQLHLPLSPSAVAINAGMSESRAKFLSRWGLDPTSSPEAMATEIYRDARLSEGTGYIESVAELNYILSVIKGEEPNQKTLDDMRQTDLALRRLDASRGIVYSNSFAPVSD